MMTSQRTHLLLLTFSIHYNHAFLTPPVCHHPTLKLHINAFTRPSGLQPLNFATEDYLDQLTPATTSPEEFLHQFIDLTSSMATNFAVESSSIMTADEVTYTNTVNDVGKLSSSIADVLEKIAASTAVSASNSINKVSIEATNAIKTGLSSSFVSIKAALPEVASKSTQLIGDFVSNTGNEIRQSTSRSMSVLAEHSIHDVAKSVLNGLELIGGLVVGVLDLFLKTFGQTSCAAIFQNLQITVNTLIQDANQSVEQIMDRILHMSVIEVLQGLTTLLITVSQALLTVVNAVVRILSGKDAGELALVATTAVTSSANELSAQAVNTAYDLTHKSVNDLTMMITDYSHNVGNEIVTTLATVEGLANSDTLTTFIP